MPPRWEGWDDAAVAPEKLGRLSARSAAAARRVQAIRRRTTATSATAASTCRSASTCRARPASASTASSSTAPPTWSCSYGGSLSGEHGDGQSRGALLPKMFGPELMHGVPRVQGACGIRDNRMNPHKARRRVSADRKPPARRRLQAAASRRRTSRFPTMAVRSPRRRCAASASASAASRTTARCARATWRRSRKSTARAAARTCCSRCCRARRCDGGWKNEHVKEALDLCLSCKACKVGVSDQRRHRDLSRRVSVALLRSARGGRCTRTRSA